MKRVHHHAGRGGFTLIEMMVIIAVSAALLTLMGGLLQQMARLNRQSQAGLLAKQQQMRLIEDIRTDIRAAEDVATEDAEDAQRLVISNGETEVAYEVSKHGLTRSVSGGESQAPREYHLGAVQMEFEIEDRLVELHVAPETLRDGGKPRFGSFQVVAAVGADRGTVKVDEEDSSEESEAEESNSEPMPETEPMPEPEGEPMPTEEASTDEASTEDAGSESENEAVVAPTP